MKNGWVCLVIWGLLASACHSPPVDTISLAGVWNVELDREETGLKNEAGAYIDLPGTLAEAGYGDPTSGSDFGRLTPTHRYVGVAWYQREIDIPENWEDKRVDIFLERVLWESKIFIDGEERSTRDALGTPHIHSIGKLSPGTHLLAIRVDNDMIHNIGDKGHAYGEYTQRIWNGIIGRMELQAKDPTHLSQIRVFSDIATNQLSVEVEIEASEPERATISLHVQEPGKSTVLIEKQATIDLEKGSNRKKIRIDLEGKLTKWDEFDPVVYTLRTQVKTATCQSQQETEFGYVNIRHNGTHILVNDRPVFLRGNLDCVHFPLTGYPSTRIEDWERIFNIYKDYGLNHVRFHSWCPPEAAFQAANRLGIYIQAEASIWIDWWMSEDMTLKGRPEMDTKGHPKGLGYDPERDEFVIAEMNRMVDFYGNHPSFAMFCIGNELGNSDFEVMEQWVAALKKKDPRRLYSVSTARKITPIDDYSATHNIQGIGRTRGLNGAGTDWDFEEVYRQMDIPIIAHEIGQWPVYPVWDEIDTYTGILKARNFEAFKAVAEKNGMADQDVELRNASGALNQLMYKYETESFLRTPSCAGVQLLSMQDYPGQGEALIGWLDTHWESKEITTPAAFRKHFDETVPLLRMKKFVWTTDEVFEAKAQLSHFGQADIAEGKIIAEIMSSDSVILAKKSWPIKNVSTGSVTHVGELSLPLSEITTAQELTISLALLHTSFKNEWKVWVYPANLPIMETEEIWISDEMNAATLGVLENGGKVLLMANKLGTEQNSVSVNFYPLYWSLTFFPGQGKTSLGLLIQDQHSAFTYFPTSWHSDWQWETFENTTRAFVLNDMPSTYKPIVQVVDDFHRNNKEGALFELKIGEGKLLVCGFDLDQEKSPVAAQLRYSLIAYMKTVKFAPQTNADESYLKRLFTMNPN